MSPIRLLPTHLVNKIAAGEVIERPASVVKELTENALDAGASRIDVTVAEGGKRLMSVVDDGRGMGPEDIALAFAPHATSKLSDEEDLFRVGTMGFRGEALASIASVSHAQIRSRRRDDETGWEVEASGPDVGEPHPCPAAAGTTVTVRDLFFNVPARRKFLKTTNTEFGHVTEQIARIALPRPQVAFTLTHNERQTQNLPAATSTLQRVGDLFGAELAEGLMPIKSRGDDTLRVSGVIAPPSAARGSSKWQYFFVNGRYVRDRSLSHALKEAYRGLIDPTRWPVAFVFIDIDPGEVDVNVHPTKIEVRFRNGQLVHGELLAALKDTLNSANLTPSAALQETDEQSADEPAELDERRQSLRQALADFFKSTPAPQPRFSFPESSPRRPAETRPDAGRYQPSRAPSGPLPLAGSPSAPTGAPAHQVGGLDPGAAPGVEPAAPHPAPAAPAAIQVDNTYLVAPMDGGGLVIVDQHALHERLLYNDLHRRLTDGSAGGLTGQRLLIPARVSVTDAEADVLAEHEGLLSRLGVEVAPFGPGTVAVQRFPSLLAERGIDCGAFLRDLLDRLDDDETTDTERLLEDVLEMMACKAAVKAGDPLTAEEIDALLARRAEAEKGSACPHGRPTAIRLTMRELEKQFKRT